MTKSNTKTLRNGKVVLSRKNSTVKKKNGKLSFYRTTSTSNFNSLNVKNKTESNERIVIQNKDCDEQNNHHSYNKLENHIQLNEVQIYNNHETKILEKKSGLITVEKPKPVPSNSINKNKKLKTNLVNDQIINPRITRSETIKLQTEERKRSDQVLIDKFPKNIFKNVVIQLYDIVEQIKFVRMLGLICRFKCSLTNSKIKKYPNKKMYFCK
ncbi:Hypothetical protein CINCED_3A016715 [Cinara cedri]|uniref:Uncharacterized protein n=1 Tax=Cinara cedri TaxID=506608 RepID=A0A5E4MDH7_9HEMI|nr:Hypothetical protein CINCED_3A016715 [Cinara cedri]